MSKKRDKVKIRDKTNRDKLKVPPIATLLSPKNSAIKGKHDNPGAKDGINIISVLPIAVSLFNPKIERIVGVMK